MGFTTYYTVERSHTIKDVLHMWMQNKKAYDKIVHNFYKPEDVWPYREYSWSRTRSRRSETEWDDLSLSIQNDGWDKNNPAIVTVGKNGVAKVSEGNHRLAIAMQFGITVPVRFEFWQTVD